jgi:hypothetical protein
MSDPFGLKWSGSPSAELHRLLHSAFSQWGVRPAALLGGIGPGLLATAVAAMTVVTFIMPGVGHSRIASLVDRIAVVFFAAWACS